MSENNPVAVAAPLTARTSWTERAEKSLLWLLAAVVVSTISGTAGVVVFLDKKILEQKELSFSGKLEEAQRELATLKKQLEEAKTSLNNTTVERDNARAAERRAVGRVASVLAEHPRILKVAAFPARLDKAMIRDFRSGSGITLENAMKPVQVTNDPQLHTNGVLLLSPPDQGNAIADIGIPQKARSFRADAALLGPCDKAGSWGSVNVRIAMGGKTVPGTERSLVAGQTRTTYDIVLPDSATSLMLIADSKNGSRWCDDLYWLDIRFVD